MIKKHKDTLLSDIKELSSEKYQKRKTYDRELFDTLQKSGRSEKIDTYIQEQLQKDVDFKNMTAEQIIRLSKKLSQNYTKTQKVVENLFGPSKVGKGIDWTISLPYKAVQAIKHFVEPRMTRAITTLLLAGLLGYGGIKTQESIREFNADTTEMMQKPDTEIVEKKKSTTESKKEKEVLEKREATPEQKALYQFGDYVALTEDLTAYDSINSKGVRYKTDFGKYARLLRFEKEIDNALQYAPSISPLAFKGLNLTEGQSNPLSIAFDGGAGTFHIQPDVAKERGLKIFTDNPKYAQWDFDKLTAQGRSKSRIYKKHGEILKGLIDKYRDKWDYIAALDERFDINKCLISSAKMLEKNYNIGIKKEKNNPQSFSELKRFAKSINRPWQEVYAINAFNKGPHSGTRSLTYGRTNTTRGHNINVAKHMGIYTKYNNMLKAGMAEGKRGAELRKYLTENANIKATLQ